MRWASSLPAALRSTRRCTDRSGTKLSGRQALEGRSGTGRARLGRVDRCAGTTHCDNGALHVSAGCVRDLSEGGIELPDRPSDRGLDVYHLLNNPATTTMDGVGRSSPGG